MAERTVLLDATAEVRGAHLTLIANGTVAVVSAARQQPKSCWPGTGARRAWSLTTARVPRPNAGPSKSICRQRMTDDY